MITSLAIAAVALSSGTARFSESQLREYLEALTSPAMGGRLTLAPGERLAADYLAQQFRRIGLQEGPHKGYIHEFEVTVNQRPTSNNVLSFRDSAGQTWRLNLGEDFLPLAGTRAMRMVNAELVYVGFGLVEDDWNDFEGVDLTGKVAVMLRGVPEGRRPASNGAKARWAAERGAAGVIFVGSATSGRRDLAPMSRGQGLAPNTEIVAASVSERHFERLVGMPLEKARQATAPASRSLGLSVRMVTETEPNRGMGRNVIGILPGNDPTVSDEIIVVGAHFDHLGYGEVGSRTNADIIHPGADDNASGVAGVLALAEHFAINRTNRRTMIFQLYSGEEVGLVGAAAWVRDNPETVRRISAMINMDMIGRLREGRLTVFSTSSSTEWDAILDAVKADGVIVNKVPSISGGSDHFPFARANVPNLFFHTGMTPEYHTENDTIDTVNFPGMVSVIDLVRQVIQNVDGREKLQWNPEAQIGGRRRPATPPAGTTTPVPADNSTQARPEAA